MTLSRWMTGVALAVFLTVPAVAAQTDKAEVALRAATEKETVEGDVKGAIEQYKKLAQNSNKSVAARALVRLGECYEKQGSADARKTYEQVLSKFGDQKDAVDQARARLAAIGGGQTGQQTTRLVWTGPKPYPAGSTVSSDGRYISYTDWDSGNLALHDITSSTDRLLTTTGSFKKGAYAYADYTAISKDGKQIAYGWDQAGNEGYEIRLANATGDPSPRRLYASDPDGRSLSPFDWSPDGKWISVGLVGKQWQLGLVATQDGSLRVLKSAERRGVLGGGHGFRNIRFSPDGKYLAYDRDAGETVSQRAIYTLAIEAGVEVQVVASSENNSLVGWSPDGKLLLFTSDGNFWAMSVADGKPQAAPSIIRRRFEGIPVGMTAAGALYFGSFATGGSEIRVDSVDLSTGKLLAQPVLPFHSSAGLQPAWSRDGKYLAWYSSAQLMIRTNDTGEVRDLKLPEACAQPNWAPDGRSLACTTQAGLSRIDAQTGVVASIMLNPAAAFTYRRPQFSPDGKKVYYLKVPKAPAPVTGGAIVERDLASGAERDVFHGDPQGAALSPDGRYFVKDSGESVAATKDTAPIFLVPVDTGVSQEIFRYPITAGPRPGNYGWTPDSRNVVVFQKAKASAPTEAWLYPIDGGTPRKLDIGASSSADTGPVMVSPDGRQVAYVLTTQVGNEVSVLENFLPIAKTTK